MPRMEVVILNSWLEAGTMVTPGPVSSLFLPSELAPLSFPQTNAGTSLLVSWTDYWSIEA
jgi:hypothetical protein